MATNVQPAPIGDIDDTDRLFGLLCYIIGIFVPGFILLSDANKARPFQRYHAVNSLMLTVAILAIFVLACIVTTIIQFIPVLGQIVGLLVSCIMGIGSLAVLGLLIWYAVLAYQGKYFEIPRSPSLAASRAGSSLTGSLKTVYNNPMIGSTANRLRCRVSPC